MAELHSQLLQATIFRDFVEFKGRDFFTNVTNGITPRRSVGALRIRSTQSYAQMAASMQPAACGSDDTHSWQRPLAGGLEAACQAAAYG